MHLTNLKFFNRISIEFSTTKSNISLIQIHVFSRTLREEQGPIENFKLSSDYLIFRYWYRPTKADFLTLLKEVHKYDPAAD